MDIDKENNSHGDDDMNEKNNSNYDDMNEKNNSNSDDMNEKNNSNDDDMNEVKNVEKQDDNVKDTMSNKIKSENDSDSYDDSNSSFDNIEDEAEKLLISKEFQENVIKYVKLDDLIRKKNEDIRELKKKRKPCEEYILKYLDNEDINCIEINDGKLRKNKSETKVPLTYDKIKTAIGTKVTNAGIIKDILQVMDSRPKKVNVNIKRTMNRKKKK